MKTTKQLEAHLKTLNKSYDKLDRDMDKLDGEIGDIEDTLEERAIEKKKGPLKAAAALLRKSTKKEMSHKEVEQYDRARELILQWAIKELLQSWKLASL